MFAKLLKHEWRATRGVITLLCVIILIAGLTIGGVMHYMIRIDNGETLTVEATAVHVEPEMSEFAEVTCILLVVAGVMAIGICCAASVFAVIWRFYKSRFTDEGYLTFTLPVTHHQLLLSSAVNSILGVLMVILACFLAVVLVLGLLLLAYPQEILWADVAVAISDVWHALLEGLEGHGSQVALLLWSALVSAVSQLLLLMLAVTIGALIAKKHKILAAIGVYYGIGLLESFCYSAVAMSAFPTENVNTLLASPGVMGVVLAVVSYFLMYWLTSRKLNLA